MLKSDNNVNGETGNEIYKYTFMIDIDYKPSNPLEFAKELANKIVFVFRTLGIVYEETEVYETNKGYHVYVYATSERKLSNEITVIIQLALGSDYRREIFNVLRLMSGEFSEEDRSWNVLFEVKRFRGKVVSKEDATPIADKMTRMINRICISKLC